MDSERSCDDGIRGCKYDYGMHQIKDKTVGNSKTAMPAGKLDTLVAGKSIAGKTVIKHRKAVVIKFHGQGNQRCNPSYKWH